MADMRHAPNIHCGLLVELDGQRFLLDPGYLVAEPVPLDRQRAVRVRLPGHTLEYRPLARSDVLELSTLNDRGESVPRYRLRARRVPEADFVRFWVASFEANGMNGLHLNRISGEGRLSAHDLNLRIDNGRDKVNVKLRDRYVATVADRFGIDRELVRRAFEAWAQNRCRSA
jgi:arylamine N-acetyltransferase